MHEHSCGGCRGYGISRLSGVRARAVPAFAAGAHEWSRSGADRHLVPRRLDVAVFAATSGTSPDGNRRRRGTPCRSSAASTSRSPAADGTPACGRRVSSVQCVRRLHVVIEAPERPAVGVVAARRRGRADARAGRRRRGIRGTCAAYRDTPRSRDTLRRARLRAGRAAGIARDRDRTTPSPASPHRRGNARSSLLLSIVRVVLAMARDAARSSFFSCGASVTGLAGRLLARRATGTAVSSVIERRGLPRRRAVAGLTARADLRARRPCGGTRGSRSRAPSRTIHPCGRTRSSRSDASPSARTSSCRDRSATSSSPTCRGRTCSRFPCCRGARLEPCDTRRTPSAFRPSVPRDGRSRTRPSHACLRAGTSSWSDRSVRPSTSAPRDILRTARPSSPRADRPCRDNRRTPPSPRATSSVEVAGSAGDRRMCAAQRRVGRVMGE